MHKRRYSPFIKVKYYYLKLRFSLLKKQENVVMFHMGRCGSTALAHHLQQHPQLGWAGEIIQFINNKNSAFHKISNFLYSNNRRSSGVEIKPFHLRNCGILLNDLMEFLEKNKFKKIILLTRKNILRSIISVQICRKTKVWHISEIKNQQHHTLHLDPSAVLYLGKTYDIIDLIRLYEKDICELEQTLSDKNILRLYYEDDVSLDPKIGYKKICEYIGIQYLQNKISLVKTNPFPLNTIVSNFEELEKRLKNTPYEWMLYDELDKSLTPGQ